MSDTPRTDVEAFLPHDSKYRVCDADFARNLERELNEANERIKRLDETLEAVTDKIDTAWAIYMEFKEPKS
jgi:ppGpp synthetase/RelA/SpoT-type nucleotidyltranferase